MGCFRSRVLIRILHRKLAEGVLVPYHGREEAFESSVLRWGQRSQDARAVGRTGYSCVGKSDTRENDGRTKPDTGLVSLGRELWLGWVLKVRAVVLPPPVGLTKIDCQDVVELVCQDTHPHKEHC